MCWRLPARTTTDIFNLISVHMAEKFLSWSKVGDKGGFIAHVKAIAPERTSSHIIHRQGLAVKKIPNAPRNVLKKAV